MTKLIRFTISILVSAAVLFSGISAVSAEADDSVIYVSAAEIERGDFTSAVQSALDTARCAAHESNQITVRVEPGEYELRKGLRIYGNTTLSLYGVYIRRVNGAYVNMLRIGSEDGVSKGVTGYYYENVAIEGGVFDADNTVQTMIKAAHAKNFSMKDITLLNALNNHMMEVAGVDGFTVKNCVFDTQTLNTETAADICYEAVQLDILKSGHIVNCRSEDLPMKNILIEGCSFKNMPRAVGSHTAILNNPLRNITIRNNTFYNMGSAAVQGLGWVDCKIENNYIEKTPRAIAMYTVGTDGKGVFLPSLLAEEGNTETTTSDEYKAPEKSNTLIANNVIKDCGSIEDVYADYNVTAIAAVGYNLTEVYPTATRGSGGLPIGDYYNDGVTVKNNYVEVQGTACRVADGRNVKISSNTFVCNDSTLYPDENYYGIVVRYDTELSSVDNNFIKNARTNGIHFGEECKADSVINNRVDTCLKHGIVFYNTSLNTLTDNVVSNAKADGISVQSGSSVKNTIERNRVYDSNSGINITATSSGIMCSNTAVKCTTPFKYTKTVTTNIFKNNYTASADAGAISADISTVELSKGKSYKLNIRTYPVNCDASVTYTSSNPEVVTAGEDGYIFAEGEGTAVVTAETANGKTAEVEVTVNSTDEDTKTTASPDFTAVSSLYNSNGGVLLQWNKISGAAKYRLMRKNADKWETLADVSSTSYTDSKVVSGTAYSYTVRAMDSDGGFIGGYDTEGAKITYVTRAIANKITNKKDSVKFEWAKVNGAARYRIFLKTGSTSWTHIGTTTKTNKTIKPVKSGESYCLALVSIDENKNPLNTIKAGSVGKFLSKPSIKLEKRSKSGKKIKISWTKVNGAKKYELNVLQTKLKVVKKVKVIKKKKKKKIKVIKKVVTYVPNTKWKKLKTTTANTLVCKGELGVDYKYTVKCFDSSGKYVSVVSDIKTIKYIKPAVKKKSNT